MFCRPESFGAAMHAPFISGDAFRFYSDYCYDEVDSWLDPASVRPRSVIFVKADLLGEFFSAIHPQIPVRYILIAHNSDAPTPGPFASFLDDAKLIAWFGQNYDGFPHPKMHPIPMGIANFCWEHGNTNLIQQVQEFAVSKRRIWRTCSSRFKRFPKREWKFLGDFALRPIVISPKKSLFVFISQTWPHLNLASLRAGTLTIRIASGKAFMWGRFRLSKLRRWIRSTKAFPSSSFRTGVR